MSPTWIWESPCWDNQESHHYQNHPRLGTQIWTLIHSVSRPHRLMQIGGVSRLLGTRISTAAKIWSWTWTWTWTWSVSGHQIWTWTSVCPLETCCGRQISSSQICFCAATWKSSASCHVISTASCHVTWIETFCGHVTWSVSGVSGHVSCYGGNDSDPVIGTESGNTTCNHNNRGEHGPAPSGSQWLTVAHMDFSGSQR